MPGQYLTLEDNATLRSARSGRYEPVFIIKCTRKCNLRCTYCTDYRQADEGAFNVGKLAELFHSLGQAPDISGSHFIWHGGEPLTKGQRYFDKIAFLQNHFLVDKDRVSNSIQTNGTLVTPEWCAQLRAYGYTVGVSLDGPETVQNCARPFIQEADEGDDAAGSFTATLSGIGHLNDAGVGLGVLTVVSDEVLKIGAREMYRFYRQHGINNIALLWMRGEFADPAASLAYNHRYGEFMVEMLDEWLGEDNTAVKVRELESKLNKLLGLPHGLCKDAGCCVGKYFGVEPDGGLWHCDKFMDDDDFYLGNIADRPLSGLPWSDRMDSIARLELDLRNQCSPCRWFEQCRGGCLSDLKSLLRDGGRVGSADCWHFRVYEALAERLAGSEAVREWFREMAPVAGQTAGC